MASQNPVLQNTITGDNIVWSIFKPNSQMDYVRLIAVKQGLERFIRWEWTYFKRRSIP